MRGLTPPPAGTKPRASYHRLPGRQAWKEGALDDLPSKDEREGHRQSGERWNRFKGNGGETTEGRGGARMGFSECTDTILN